MVWRDYRLIFFFISDILSGKNSTGYHILRRVYFAISKVYLRLVYWSRLQSCAREWVCRRWTPTWNTSHIFHEMPFSLRLSELFLGTETFYRKFTENSHASKKTRTPLSDILKTSARGYWINELHKTYDMPGILYATLYISVFAKERVLHVFLDVTKLLRRHDIKRKT